MAEGITRSDQDGVSEAGSLGTVRKGEVLSHRSLIQEIIC